jgi:hypothetical protein
MKRNIGRPTLTRKDKLKTGKVLFCERIRWFSQILEDKKTAGWFHGFS